MHGYTLAGIYAAVIHALLSADSDGGCCGGRESDYLSACAGVILLLSELVGCCRVCFIRGQIRALVHIFLAVGKPPVHRSLRGVPGREPKIV